jgi:hypothetical protein
VKKFHWISTPCIGLVSKGQLDGFYRKVRAEIPTLIQFHWTFTPWIWKIIRASFIVGGKFDAAMPTEAQTHFDYFITTGCFRESASSSKLSSSLKIARLWLTNQVFYIMHQWTRSSPTVLHIRSQNRDQQAHIMSYECLINLLVTWCTNKFNIQQLYALPTLYLCVLYLCENKQRVVPLTA